MQSKTWEAWEEVKKQTLRLPPPSVLSDGEKDLVEWQRNKGYSNKEMADILSVSDKAYGKWVTGHQLPSLQMRKRIDTLCGIHPLSWLDT